jgi:hypothetical protein
VLHPERDWSISRPNRICGDRIRRKHGVRGHGVGRENAVGLYCPWRQNRICPHRIGRQSGIGGYGVGGEDRVGFDGIRVEPSGA